MGNLKGPSKVTGVKVRVNKKSSSKTQAKGKKEYNIVKT